MRKAIKEKICQFCIISVLAMMTLSGCGNEDDNEKTVQEESVKNEFLSEDSSQESAGADDTADVSVSEGMTESTQNEVSQENTMEDPWVLNYAEIEGIEGIYITKGEDGFMQAPEGHMWQTVEGSAKYYTSVFPPNVCGIDPNLVIVPELQEGDQLAIICSDAEKPVYIYPVKEEGYTIRARLSEKGIQPFGHYELQGQVIKDSVIEVEDVDDEAYSEFLANKTVNSLEAYSEDTGSYSTKWHLLRANQGETYTFGSFEGTTYNSETYTADVHYFAYDSLLKPEPEYTIELTRNGYGVIDTSGLQNGTYVIQTYIEPAYSAKQSIYIIKINR